MNFLKFFSRSKVQENESIDELPAELLANEFDIRILSKEIKEIILKNKFKLVENENLIAHLQAKVEYEKQKLKEKGSSSLKRCLLYRIKSIKSRIKTLSRCSEIYNNNCDLHAFTAEKVENMRVAGLKIITIDQVETIALDHEENYQKHKDLISMAKITGSIETVEYDFKDDPELLELAKEHGLI